MKIRANLVTLAGLSLIAVQSSSAAAAGATVVSSSSELVAAVSKAAPDDTIRLKPGEYLLEQMLNVPDGVTLDGGGNATVVGEGAPESVVVDGAAILRAADSLPGDLLSLGDGAQLRGLHIVQAPPSAGRAQFGNTVVVRSRRPGDRVTATISECEMHSNATYGAGSAGPTGRLILVQTRSPDGEPPHESAILSLVIERSAIDAPLGNAIFVNNFAARSRIRLDVRRSLVTGFVAVTGGTTRGSRVTTNANSEFHSEDTRYRSGDDGFDKFGWLLFGASGMPVATSTSTIAGGVGNRSEVTSRRDRIEGFHIGVLGSGYRSVADFSEPGMDNRLELAMQGTVIRSSGDGAADFVLRGAGADVAAARAVRIAPGARNEVRARLDDVRGSGPRANRYVDCDCLATHANSNNGNRVVVAGTRAAFASANPTILPPPPGAAFAERER